ncbi:hypothetical protein, partial [Slackia piriformis]|uniref:hypothetical protein n=1 Tax=Slackia piriformis TaxID=626934 RepID=UPI0039F5FA28
SGFQGPRPPFGGLPRQAAGNYITPAASMSQELILKFLVLSSELYEIHSSFGPFAELILYSCLTNVARNGSREHIPSKLTSR